MALFKIEKGLAADLSKNRPKVHDGWCYFTTDDGKFYIDIANDENAVLTNYPGGAGNRVPLNAFYADRVNFIPQIGAGHDKTTGELHLQIITGKKYDTATNTVVDNASGYLKLPAASKGKEGILSLDTQFIGGTKVLTDSPVFADGVKLATKNTLTGADFTLDKVSTCKYVMSLAQQTNVNTGNLFLYSSGNNNLYHNSSDNQILTQKTINDSMIPWGGNTKAGLSPIVAAASYLHSANRIQFANPAGITVEYSQNNGTTWTDYGLSNADKVKLVSGLGSSAVIGKRSSGVTIRDKVRITMNATSMGVYTAAKKILFNITTNGAQGCTVLVEKSTIGKPTEFTTVGTYPVDGWSGWNAIPLGVGWGGSASQTSQVASFRFTFGITSLHTNTSYKNTLSVLDIMLIGDTYWTVPSNMAKTGHLYAWDESQNATFPAGIKTTTTLQVTGTTTLKSSLSVTGITTLSDTLSVAGEATMCQITPKTDSSHSLGTNEVRWANGYFDAIYTPEIKQNLKIVGNSSDVPLVIKSNASTAYLKFEGTGGRLGSYGFSSADVPVVYISGTGDSKIVHEKNQATLKITVKGLLGSDDTTIQYNPLTAQTLEINPDEMFHKYTFNKSTTFSTAYTWYNTGVAGTNMETGAYLISLSIGNDQYIGTMSWYAGSDVGSTDYDEIVLHKAGKATAGSCFYLRTKRTSTTLSLQISSNKKITTSTSYTITARKLL